MKLKLESDKNEHVQNLEKNLKVYRKESLKLIEEMNRKNIERNRLIEESHQVSQRRKTFPDELPQNNGCKSKS